MTSWFRTTGRLKQVEKLPAEISSERAIEVLQNHAYFFKCDPHMIKFEPIPRPSDAVESLPDTCGDEPTGEPKFYSVTDNVPTLPKGIWDSKVISSYEMVNLRKGLFVRMRAPLGVVMETVYQCDAGEDGSGRVTLTADVLIETSRLLFGFVKGTCESDWVDIRKNMIDIMMAEQ